MQNTATRPVSFDQCISVSKHLLRCDALCVQGGVRRSTVGCAQAVVGHDRLCAPIRDMKEMAIMERDRSTESPFSLAGNALIRVLVKMAPQPPPPMILLSVLARLIWFIR